MCARGARSPASARRRRSLPIQLWPLDCSITASVRAGSSPTPLGQRQRLGRAGQVDGGQQVVDELGARAVAGRARRRGTAGSASCREQRLAQRSKTASSQATIRLIVPSRARAGPPDIGASMQRQPARRRAAPRRARRRPARWSGTASPRRRAAAPRRRRRRRTAPPRVCAASTTATISSVAARAPARPASAATSQPAACGAAPRAPASMSRTATRQPALAQAQRHRPAHVADADDADARPAHLCISRRLRAIDIRMPSPSPSVTIAVPP